MGCGGVESVVVVLRGKKWCGEALVVWGGSSSVESVVVTWR